MVEEPSVSGLQNDATACLPLELRRAVLDHVPQQFVLTMGGVSRAWRNAATSHPGFYVKIRQFIRKNGMKACSHLSAALNRAMSANLRVSLFLEIAGHDDSEDNLLVHLFDIFRVALLNCLVHVKITVPQAALPGVLHALGAPAPYLRSLSIRRRHYPQDLRPDIGVVDASLFGGHAPRLRSVELENVYVLSGADVPCFKGVTDVVITAHRFTSDIYISRLFPSARSIAFHSVGNFQASNGALTLDMGNLSLAALRVRQDAKTFTLRRLPRRIRVIEVSGFDDFDLATYLSAVPAPLSWDLSLGLNLGEFREFVVSSRSLYSEDEVTFRKNPNANVAGGLECLYSRLGDVIDMCIHQGFLFSIISSWSGASLTTLKHLTITLDLTLSRPIWPPPPHWQFSLWRRASTLTHSYSDSELLNDMPQFPALSRLVIQSHSNFGPLVELDQVLSLAHALRLKPFQCSLTLANVRWRYPPGPGTVDVIFHTITLTQGGRAIDNSLIVLAQ